MKPYWKFIWAGLVACLALSAGEALAGRFGGGGIRGGGFHAGGGIGGASHFGGFSGSAPLARPSPAGRPDGGSYSYPPSGSYSIHGPHGGGIGDMRPEGGVARPGRADFATRPGANFATCLGGGGAGVRHVWQTPRGGTMIGGGGQHSFTGPGSVGKSSTPARTAL